MDDATRRIEAIFTEALRRPERDGREAYVATECGEDRELRGRVEALLSAHDAAREFMAGGVGLGAGGSDVATVDESVGRAGAGRADLVERPGTMVGRYKLLQQIGEGGFGMVYMAEQEWPVKRRVALKVIKAGMDTRGVIARFEAERQALAMMDHPNIARVLDAGATATGLPYFVMELVKGVPITEYCDQANLEMRGRLGLFMDVCRAVQHAHQKGVIHRDLKPSNIMITLHDGKPVVKVIDFGIAKATDQKLTEMTLFTNYGQMIGTPEYMSPEQAVMSGLDVDTRSDVYSLGVLLYELLTGAPPFGARTLRQVGFDEMRRIIREQAPPKPSARVGALAPEAKVAVAAHRQASAQGLVRQLHGDLDWIVLKALEKDRARRYETANGLAADLRRHLNHEPVLARPPSRAYLFRKSIRRNRVAYAAVAGVAVSLLVGIAGSVWQAVRATHAERRAVTTLDELRATAPAFAEQARALAARERFDEAIEKLDYAVKLRPDVAEYLVAKGDLLQCQLKLAEAAAVYRAALGVSPGVARAGASAALCDELLAAPPGKDGRLTRESLAKLSLAMQGQQRPAAELMPVARLLGEEKRVIVEYWLARLKDLPVSAEKSLKDRLTVRDDGRLALDLSGTKVSDLSALSGAPLATLDVSKCKELTDLSPLRGMELLELNVGLTGVSDLAPLDEMMSLEKLELSGSKVADLAPLGALRLKQLGFSDCPISDLTAIGEMPLEEINLRGTRVANLSPLVGMPVKSIDLTMAPVLDFSPLAKLPLEKCYLQRNRITDLSVLRGKPLKELVLWGCTEARNYRVIASMPTLELLLLPSEYRELPDEDYEAIGSLRNLPNLRQLGSEIMNQMGYAATGSKELFWADWDREQAFVPALRRSGIKFSLSKLATGTYSVSITRQPLGDLSILRGAPISELTLFGCQVTDLTPLRELPLEFLNVPGNPISDLGPLRGTRIKALYLTGTKVSDLSPLKDLPLDSLYLGECEEVTDVAALAEIRTLEHLVVPIHAAHIGALRALPRLQRLAFRHTSGEPYIPEMTAAEFWRHYGANAWIEGLRAQGVKAREIQLLDDGTWFVNLDNSAVRDLAVLRGAPISRLSVGDTGVADLTPLRGMRLKRLVLWRTGVKDLGPLRGMPLEELILNDTPVADLGPLRGMPLRLLHFNATRVTDLSPLAGMPLTSVRMHDCPGLTDLSPLAKVTKLTHVTLPPDATKVDVLRGLPHLERVSFTERDMMPDETAAEFWRDFDGFRALRESGLQPREMVRLNDGTWRVNFDSSPIKDLSILRGAPISELWLMDTAVADLSPLRGMPLRKLGLYHTKVTDLAPLKGMRLEYLNLVDTKVTDLSALRGMPLTSLRLHHCSKLTDVSPLKEVRELTTLTLPAGAEEIEFLRGFTHLERLSFREDAKNGYRPDKTATEFWRGYDGGRR